MKYAWPFPGGLWIYCYESRTKSDGAAPLGAIDRILVDPLGSNCAVITRAFPF